MEDLGKLALIFIYPDGIVEKIPIGKYKLHVEYMKEHLGKSSKFYDLCKELDFETYLHGHIDLNLSISGVIVILNLDVEDIVNGKFIWESKIPNLFAVLPEHLHSMEQTLALENIYNRYPNWDYECFDSNLTGYQYSKEISMQDYIVNAKSYFESRSV